jgi:hypothetical protein
MNYVLAFLLAAAISTQALASEKGCPLENSREAVITRLFSGKEHLYSLLWWTDPKSKTINARSFVINGHDSIPIFTSEDEGKKQVKGSGFEKDLVGIDPALLAGILQEMEYAILNPGGVSPVQFKTCIVKQYAKPGA